MNTSKHTPKNTVTNHTGSFKRMRQQQLDFYNSTPFYGNPLAEKLYTSLKSRFNIIQASVCGVFVNVVCYKQDADNISHILYEAFKVPAKQRIDELTEFVNVTIVNK